MRTPTRFLLCCLLMMMLAHNGCSGTPRAIQPVREPADVLDEAEAALEADSKLSLDLIDQVLAIETEDQDTLVRVMKDSRYMAQRLYRNDELEGAISLFLKSASMLRQLEESGAEFDPDTRGVRGAIYYDEACALSLSGQPEHGLKALERASELGYGDVGLFEEDSDLTAIRDLPQYAAFKANALAEMREKVAEQMENFAWYPFQLDIETLDGEQITLDQLRGKVVVLDIWATWCGPCVRTIPHLEAIYKEHRDQGLEIIGLNKEGKQGEEVIAQVKKFIADKRIPYPNALLDRETLAQIPGFRGLPTMIFIDRAGHVRYQEAGASSKEYLMAVLDPLLKEKLPEETEKAVSELDPPAAEIVEE